MSDSPKKILVTGASGQVGSAVIRLLSPKFDLMAADLGPIVDASFKSVVCDLSVAGEISRVVAEYSPDIIVNPAAYTDVEGAEDNQKLAKQINSDSVLELADAAQKIDARVIHFSTDYVYRGEGSLPQDELSDLAPINFYAESKLLGENNLMSRSPESIILRTSWVYSKLGKNFPNTILKLAAERPQLRVIDDQWGAPTSATALAEVVEVIIAAISDKGAGSKKLSGIYNCVCAGETNWFRFAEFVCETAKAGGAKLKVEQITPVPSTEYKTRAKRPLNSRLDTSKFERTFDFTMPNWQEAFKKEWSANPK